MSLLFGCIGIPCGYAWGQLLLLLCALAVSLIRAPATWLSQQLSSWCSFQAEFWVMTTQQTPHNAPSICQRSLERLSMWVTKAMHDFQQLPQATREAAVFVRCACGLISCVLQRTVRSPTALFEAGQQI